MSYNIVPIKPSVFRAYDIRGLVDAELTEHAYYTLGLALGLALQSLDRSSVFVARDGRLTSEVFAKALMTGLLDQGIEVIDLGAVSTPMLYFATHAGKTDSGLIVTGSHNPADYNGLKMVLAGKTLVHDDIERLYQHVLSLQQGFVPATTAGVCQIQSIVESYSTRILSDVWVHRSMKVVVDCGHGIAGPFVPSILEALGCEVIPLYCEVDGCFPAHHPDPTIESNLLDLREAVLKHGADIGLGFDGDGDRLGVLTEKGDIIWPDRLMMYYTQDILQRYPGANIVFDVKCSKKLNDIIHMLGGKAIMCPTGHSIVKAEMKNKDAPLAGEMSGHLFFKDRWYGFDDALYSACRLLELLSQHQGSVSEQFSRVPAPVATPELKIPVEDDQKFELMRRFTEEVTFKNANRITIDGVRMEFSNGWGLLRASNTTPCLVARFEADTDEALQIIQTLFKDALLKLSRGLTLPF